MRSRSKDWVLCHPSVGAAYKYKGWSLFAGYGKTHVSDSEELNFSLTPYENSDNRNFIQTTGQLDDYVWDGERVVKVGVDYEPGRLLNLPGLVAGVSFVGSLRVKVKFLKSIRSWCIPCPKAN